MEKSQLRHVEVDVSDCPDLFPAVCVSCAVADGVSTITGTRRLRLKESNRILAMKDGLRQMGIETRETENSFTIHGGKPRAARVDPHHDHRIAMAFTALGLCNDGVTIRDAECVNKSYPSFWDDLRSLGPEVTEC
jgi:3-phosphoshikimate 1-carboxyvinyltransferase